MTDKDRYCIDILHQIKAVRGALSRAENQVLRDHAAHCVRDAIESANRAEQLRKLDDLVDLFERAKR